jgi:hypothetical protein
VTSNVGRRCENEGPRSAGMTSCVSGLGLKLYAWIIECRLEAAWISAVSRIETPISLAPGRRFSSDWPPSMSMLANIVFED